MSMKYQSSGARAGGDAVAPNMKLSKGTNAMGSTTPSNGSLGMSSSHMGNRALGMSKKSMGNKMASKGRIKSSMKSMMA